MFPATAPPEGHEGPVFEFELDAKSMIVTDESAKPLKLAKWWLDLPDTAGDIAGTVWWHHAAVEDDKFTIRTVEKPPSIFFAHNSLPMHFAPGFKTLWSLQWHEKEKSYKPYKLYVYTTRKCVVTPTGSVCVYRSHSLPAKGSKARKRPRGSQGALKRRTKRTAGRSDDRSGESE